VPGAEPARAVVEPPEPMLVAPGLLVEPRVAEKEPDLLSDVVEPAQLALGEAPPRSPPHHVEAADDLVLDDQRQEQPGLMREAPEHPVGEARVARDVVRVHQAPLLAEREKEALLLERQR